MEGIKDTILKFLRIDNLASNVTGYVETRVKLLKIEIKEDVAKVLSKGLAQATIIFFAFLFLIFFSIGLAEYLNTYFANSFEGYLIISGVYLILFLLFLIFRKPLNKIFETYFSELINKNEE
ncbi:MAG: phage holin family protein [Cyclobacteriaceae bacterium]